MKFVIQPWNCEIIQNLFNPDKRGRAIHVIGAWSRADNQCDEKDEITFYNNELSFRSVRNKSTI